MGVTPLEESSAMRRKWTRGEKGSGGWGCHLESRRRVGWGGGSRTEKMEKNRLWHEVQGNPEFLKLEMLCITG